MSFADLAQYGILGICLFCLGWYVLHMEKQHKEEIKDLRAEQNEIRREHKEESSKLADAFNGLKETMRDLVEELRARRLEK